MVSFSAAKSMDTGPPLVGTVTRRLRLESPAREKEPRDDHPRDEPTDGRPAIHDGCGDHLQLSRQLRLRQWKPPLGLPGDLFGQPSAVPLASVHRSSRIAFTGPGRSAKASPMRTISPRFTLHSLFSHVPQTRQGHHVIPRTTVSPCSCCDNASAPKPLGGQRPRMTRWEGICVDFGW